ncbi:hypothetical protein ABIB66_005339 [Bradyrhizobium sp. F1.13.3]
MTQAGVYGQRLGQGLRSEQAPVLITRSLHSSELAVTEVRNDDPTPDISGSLAAEDAYLVSLKLRDIRIANAGRRAAVSPRRMFAQVRPICTTSSATRAM